MINNLVAGSTEDVDIIITHQFMDLDVGTILCTQSYRTVEHEFHVTGAAGFLGGQRDLLGNITCRNQLFCQGHIVVFHHDHVEVRADLRIVVHDFLQTQDQMDDILGDGVSRSGLGAKDYGNWCFRQVSFFDLQIFIDHIQGIHLLTFVLMQTFYLNIEDRVFIKSKSLGLFQIFGHRVLIILFDLQQTGKDFFLI